jgi:hypothetical protein
VLAGIATDAAKSAAAQFCSPTRLSNVTQADDADEAFVTIENWQPAHLLLSHIVSHVPEILVLEDVLDVGRHDLAHFGPRRILAFCDKPQGDIAVGYHTHEPVTFADRQNATVLITHNSACLLYIVIGISDPDIGAHHVSNNTLISTPTLAPSLALLDLLFNRAERLFGGPVCDPHESARPLQQGAGVFVQKLPLRFEELRGIRKPHHLPKYAKIGLKHAIDQSRHVLLQSRDTTSGDSGQQHEPAQSLGCLFRILSDLAPYRFELGGTLLHQRALGFGQRLRPFPDGISRLITRTADCFRARRSALTDGFSSPLRSLSRGHAALPGGRCHLRSTAFTACHLPESILASGFSAVLALLVSLVDLSRLNFWRLCHTSSLLFLTIQMSAGLRAGILICDTIGRPCCAGCSSNKEFVVPGCFRQTGFSGFRVCARSGSTPLS